MNYKAIALGAAVGFLFALSPSCGEADDCAETCNGCCDDSGTCIEAADTTAQACGTGGQTCTACTAGQTCSNGTCVGGNTNVDGGNDSGTGCGPDNCTGCCATTSSGTICLTGGSKTNCGTGGVACAECTGAMECNDATRTCQAPDAGTQGVGTPCVGNPNTQWGTDLGMAPAAAGECGDLNTNIRFCKQEFSYGNLAYPDGYCTRLCITDSNCGSDSACVYHLGLIGESVNQCFKTCTADDQCRDGYVCVGVRSNPQTSVCLPAPIAADGGIADDYELVDAGPPAGPGIIGSPCTDDTTCRPPDTGQCIEEVATLPDGGMTSTGYWGGYCTANADFGASGFCGEDGIALPYLVSGSGNQPESALVGWFCEKECTSPGTQAECRDGYTCAQFGNNDVYICEPLPDGGTP